MLIDAHAHIFPQINGRIGSGPTRGAGYGRLTAGPETIQLIPPYGLETIFTPEMLIANLDWAGVDKAVLLQVLIMGNATPTCWTRCTDTPAAWLAWPTWTHGMQGRTACSNG